MKHDGKQLLHRDKRLKHKRNDRNTCFMGDVGDNSPDDNEMSKNTCSTDDVGGQPKKKKKLNLWPQVPLSRIDLYEEGVLLLLIDIQHILQKIIVWTPLGRVCLSKHNDFHRTIYVTHESWVTLAGLQPS